nr:unnamed protein product [Callosobruchus chinensis]
MKGLQLISPYDIDLDKRRKVAKELFPSAKDRWDNLPAQRNIVPFWESELGEALQKMKKGKAPGPDKLPTEAVIEAAAVSPSWILELFNGLLIAQDFPKEWKTVRLVLIPKAVGQD